MRILSPRRYWYESFSQQQEPDIKGTSPLLCQLVPCPTLATQERRNQAAVILCPPLSSCLLPLMQVTRLCSFLSPLYSWLYPQSNFYLLALLTSQRIISLYSMGNCLAVEVRETPSQGSGRHTVVREKDKSAYRYSDESTVYRPRSSSVRHYDYQPRDDFVPFESTRYDDSTHHRTPIRPEHRTNNTFEPLPPPIPLQQPLIHNNYGRNDNPNGIEILDLGGGRSNHHDEIQILDDPVSIVPRSPRSRTRNRQMVVHSSKRGGKSRKYYDDSDDDSWVERRPRSGYADDSRVEVYRPGRRSTRKRSRSRNSRYYR